MCIEARFSREIAQRHFLFGLLLSVRIPDIFPVIGVSVNTPQHYLHSDGKTRHEKTQASKFLVLFRVQESGDYLNQRRCLGEFFGACLTVPIERITLLAMTLDT